MVEIFGRIESQSTENATQTTVFRIPAFSESIARQRAMFNARIKDFQSAEVTNTEVVGTGDIPRQKIIDVTVQSDR